MTPVVLKNSFEGTHGLQTQKCNKNKNSRMKLDYLSDDSNSGIFQREIFVLFNSMKNDQKKLYCS